MRRRFLRIDQREAGGQKSLSNRRVLNPAPIEVFLRFADGRAEQIENPSGLCILAHRWVCSKSELGKCSGSMPPLLEVQGVAKLGEFDFGQLHDALFADVHRSRQPFGAWCEVKLPSCKEIGMGLLGVQDHDHRLYFVPVRQFPGPLCSIVVGFLAPDPLSPMAGSAGRSFVAAWRPLRHRAAHTALIRGMQHVGAPGGKTVVRIGGLFFEQAQSAALALLATEIVLQLARQRRPAFAGLDIVHGFEFERCRANHCAALD